MGQQATIIGISESGWATLDFDAHAKSFKQAALELESDGSTFLGFVVTAATASGNVHCYYAGDRKDLLGE